MNSMHAPAGGKSRKIAIAGTPYMESLLDSPVAPTTDVDAASVAGALESQRLRIHEQMEAQRRRLAAIQRELAEQLGRLSQQQPAQPPADVQPALDEALAECEQLRARVAAQDAELAGLRLAVESLRQEVESLRQEGQSLRQEGQSRRQEGQSLAAENKQLGEELAQRPVAPSDAEIAQAHRADAELQEEHENLQRRYQMALDDLKAERAQVAQFESKLAQAAAGQPPSPAAGPSAGSDWESQKRRLLASLEADFDENSEVDRRDRATIEEAIRRTDAIIAAKNQEVRQLQSLLEEQSANVGSMAVGAAAVAEVLDKDEVVRQERQNLQALQDEWRDKLRHAEVEISVQRAKLARHQAELEERARAIDQQSRGTSSPGQADEGKDNKPTRGRWLRRLGLLSGDEE
jgi:chromosome segregation ATPase